MKVQKVEKLHSDRLLLLGMESVLPLSEPCESGGAEGQRQSHRCPPCPLSLAAAALGPGRWRSPCDPHQRWHTHTHAQTREQQIKTNHKQLGELSLCIRTVHKHQNLHVLFLQNFWILSLHKNIFLLFLRQKKWQDQVFVLLQNWTIMSATQDRNKTPTQQAKKELCQHREKQQLHRLHHMTRHVSVPPCGQSIELHSDTHLKYNQSDSLIKSKWTN